MAISALNTQRLVAHRLATIGQLLRLMAGGAGELLVISIELKPRVPLMVKHQLTKVFTINMTLRAAHVCGRPKLSDVRITVTGLAVSADCPREGSP